MPFMDVCFGMILSHHGAIRFAYDVAVNDIAPRLEAPAGAHP
jgi:hypothetical protein